ncbi:UPF0755 protein [Persephonella hydrogeniphila]|uniref:Endolytic murein transglycosylase n=1 Tax=Persephonella hydrogeniphila TaxID=198703 RepID=A0A285MY82_9AQUI|nr:endolytic transglycosylase MltG [Persephonella hydrogeniphila]SNZ02134.1 UPF0755 protein [Persephonella hydrogeniphila]
MIRYFLFFLAAIFLSIGASLYIQVSKKEFIEPTEIYIPKGSTIEEIGEILKKNRVIKNKTVFELYSRIKNKPLKYGYYRFEGSLSIKDVWEVLYRGKERLFRFTIIPGEDLLDIGKKLEREGFIKKGIFYSFVFDKKNLKRYKLEGDSFEGYFPPETYFFRKNPDITEIVETFLQVFKKKYTPILEKAGVNGLSPYQIMIIASLVEKETSILEEKPIIAGVIINRLRKNMKLQIDPTVIYALKLSGVWNGNLTKKNMGINSPYNTYLYKGLPPTPISSFSIETLKSVVHYKKTDYLYFFSKDGKRHIFSENYKEHIRKMTR